MAKDIVRLLGPKMTGAEPNAYTGPLKAGQHSWDMVLERWGVPLIDSEVNLMQQISKERIEDFITTMALPGWLKASNFGASTAVDLQYEASGPYISLSEDSWLVGNGKVIHVSNPSFNENGGLRISLPALPSIGTTRHDLVYLEFWRHEIAPTGTDTAAAPATPTVLEDPTSSRGLTRQDVFVNGGVQNGILDNDLLTTAATGIGGSPFGETTRRIQVRWRIKTATNVNFTTYKFGLGTANGATNPSILAQGGRMGAGDATGIATYSFTEVPPQEGLGDLYTNLSEAFGKGRLWRTGANTVTAGNDLNTVDGYVYAVPMFHLTMSGNGLDAAVDMRQLSHVFLPDHSIHADTLTVFDDPSQPGVYGAAFESVVDPNLGRTVKSNIRRKSITGGTNGDIALNTITGDNIVDNSINSTFITNNSITINKLNIDSIGLPTVYIQNRSGATRSNGDVVILERDPGQTWNGFYVANSAGHMDGELETLGVVANFNVDGTEATIVNGASGYVRLLGMVAKVNVTGSIVPGEALGANPAAPGALSPAGSVYDVVAYAVTGGPGQVRALLVPRLKDATVRTSKLAEGAVLTSKIGDNQVSAAKIAPANILNAHIADGQITTRHYINFSITPEKIQPNSLTSDQIADRNILSRSIAVGNITSTELGNNAVQNNHIINGAITAAKIADGNVTRTKIANGNIFSEHYAANSILAAAIAPAQILTGHIGFGQVIHDNIATGNIDSALIANQGVSNANLAAGCVTPSKITNKSVTNDKVGVPLVFSFAVNTAIGGPDTFPLTSGVGPQDMVWQQYDYLNTAAACGFDPTAIWNPATDHTLIHIVQDGIYLVNVEAYIQPSAVDWWLELQLIATVRAAGGASPGSPYPLSQDRRYYPGVPPVFSATVGYVTFKVGILTTFSAGDEVKTRIANQTSNASTMTGLGARLSFCRLGALVNATG